MKFNKSILMTLFVFIVVIIFILIIYKNKVIDNFDNFGIYVDSSEVPMVWKTATTNYDNIFISMLTFYEIF